MNEEQLHKNYPEYFKWVNEVLLGTGIPGVIVQNKTYLVFRNITTSVEELVKAKFENKEYYEKYKHEYRDIMQDSVAYTMFLLHKFYQDGRYGSNESPDVQSRI